MKPSLCSLALTALGLLLLESGSTSAQPVIIGRVLIGGPSNNGVDTGWGYYPGDHGFSPGYGYYPDPYYVNAPQVAVTIGRWRAVQVMAPAPDPDADVASAAAVMRVRVPADAAVWVGDTATTQRGRLRRFVTPLLETGRDQGYEIRARWTEDGKPVERTEVVRVHPGDRLTVDFLAPAQLNPPRKLDGR